MTLKHPPERAPAGFAEQSLEHAVLPQLVRAGRLSPDEAMALVSREAGRLERASATLVRRAATFDRELAARVGEPSRLPPLPAE